MRTDHLDFRLEFADAVRAAAIGVPEGFPMLRWPDETVCELGFSVFDWLHDKRKAAPGTLKALAFDLREWLAFCLRHGWDPEEPSDGRLAAWRADLVEPGGGGITAGRAEKKVARIFGMYRILHLAMPWGREGSRSPVTVEVVRRAQGPEKLLIALYDDRDHGPGPVGNGEGEKHDTARLTGHRVGERLRWTGSNRGAGVGARRPIPSDGQVSEVLERLRSGVAGEGLADYPTHLGDRDWLIGRAAEGAGCRAAEISRLDLQAIATMLRSEGLTVDGATGTGIHQLDALAGDPAGWRKLLAGIDGREAVGRTVMFLPVYGKNRKERLAPIGLDLVRDLLQVGIASVRRTQIAAWRAAGWCGTPGHELFLSGKTRDRIREGSIGDLLARGFSTAPPIPGSGHRLRANYAVTTAIRIFGEALKRFGGEMSPTMVEAAYAELALALGHDGISTTVRFYLELARTYHLQVPRNRSRALAIILREIQGATDIMPVAKLLVLRTTVQALLRCDLGSEYMDLLEFLPGQADLRGPIRSAG